MIVGSDNDDGDWVVVVEMVMGRGGRGDGESERWP